MHFQAQRQDRFLTAKPRRLSPHRCVPCQAEGIECWSLTGTVDGWIEVDQPVASVMPSLESDVNEHGTVTWRDFTAYTLLLLIALICPSCFIQTQACCGAHHPKLTALTNAHDCHAMMVNFTLIVHTRVSCPNSQDCYINMKWHIWTWWTARGAGQYVGLLRTKGRFAKLTLITPASLTMSNNKMTLENK